MPELSSKVAFTHEQLLGGYLLIVKYSCILSEMLFIIVYSSVIVLRISELVHIQIVV